MKPKRTLYAGLGFATVKVAKLLANRHVRTALLDFRRGRKSRKARQRSD